MRKHLFLYNTFVQCLAAEIDKLLLTSGQKRKKKTMITLFAWFICDVIWPCIILKDCPVKTYKKCKCILFTVPLWPLGILVSKYLILFFFLSSISVAIEIISHRYMFFSVIAHIFPVEKKHFYTLEGGKKIFVCWSNTEDIWVIGGNFYYHGWSV